MPRGEKAIAICSKGRIVLNHCEVVEIYQYKLALLKSKHMKRGKSSRLAEKYGVSPKTIRDIWSHRTWKEVTKPFWPKDPADVVDLTTLCAELNAAGAGGVTSAGVLVATATPATAAGVLVTSASPVPVVPMVWDWGQVAMMPAAPASTPWWNAADLFGVNNTLNTAWDSLAPLEDPFHGDWRLW